MLLLLQDRDTDHNFGASGTHVTYDAVLPASCYATGYRGGKLDAGLSYGPGARAAERAYSLSGPGLEYAPSRAGAAPLLE